MQSSSCAVQKNSRLYPRQNHKLLDKIAHESTRSADSRTRKRALLVKADDETGLRWLNNLFAFLYNITRDQTSEEEIGSKSGCH
jgi:hypothetical protein